MKSILHFLRVSSVAMAVILSSGISTELYSMNRANTFTVQFDYVMPQTKKTMSVEAEVAYVGNHVTGEDLYVAAEGNAPAGFSVARINKGRKQIADNTTRVFVPAYGDQEFVFTIYAQ